MKKLLKNLKKLVKKEEEVSEAELEKFEEAIEDVDMDFGVESFAKSILALEHKVKTQASRLKSVDQHASKILSAIKQLDDKIDALTQKVESFEKRRFKKK